MKFNLNSICRSNIANSAIFRLKKFSSRISFKSLFCLRQSYRWLMCHVQCTCVWYTLTQQQQQQQRHRICLSHRLCMYICDVCSSVDFDSCMVARGHIDIFVLLTSFLSVHLCSWLSSFDSVIILYNLCAVHIRTWYDFDRLNKKKIAILAPLTQWYRKTVQQLGPSIHIQNFIVCSQLTAQAVSSTASSTVSNSNSYIQPKVELKKFSCVKSEWKSVSVVRRAQK